MHTYTFETALGQYVAGCGSRLLALFGSDRALIDAEGRLELKGGHERSLCSVTGDDTRVLSASWGEIRIWSPGSGEDVRRETTSRLPIPALHGSMVYFLDDRGLCAWDLDSDERRVVGTAKHYGAAQYGGEVCASSGSLAVLVSNSTRSADNVIRSVDPASGKAIKLPVHRPKHAAFLGDNLVVGASEGGGRLDFFRPNERRAYAELEIGNCLRALATAPTSLELVASSVTEGVVRIVDTDSRPRAIPLGVAADWLACNDAGYVVAARGARALVLGPNGEILDSLALPARVHQVAMTDTEFAIALGDGIAPSQIRVGRLPSPG